MLQRPLSAGFIAPCLPTKTTQLPSGSQWLHEIKHDGFRVIARKKGAQARLYSRPGNDLTRRFPLIVDTLSRLRSRLCIIDGEAVACDDNGVASFDLVRHQRANGSVFLYAFDLIELTRRGTRRAETCHDGWAARHDELTNAPPAAWFGTRCTESNRKPRACRGLELSNQRRSLEGPESL
jgi:hypothetical protein